MTDTLTIATGTPRLDLPLDAVTQTFAILAMRGRGKTYTGSVMVEEMIGAGLPVCVIDPTGAWWGLRSSANGKHPGLRVVIFGGKHADVPLEPTAGKIIADLLVENPLPCVIDLTAFDSKAEEIRFMTDFLTRLYRTNSHPLHLMIDEADEFAPQQSFPEGKRLLGAMEQIVRRGRIKGLGCTLITQRPAVLNKNVLSQTDTLILLGMTGAHDIKAMDEWVGKHVTDNTDQQIKASLPGLPIGTAWVWSPAWLGITRKIRVRKRHTFDSSATPKVGQRAEVRTMADVDLDALGEQIKATVEKAEAEDPSALRRRIFTLERELSIERAKPAPAPPEPERIEVPVLSDEQWGQWRDLTNGLTNVMSKMGEHLFAIRGSAPDPRLVIPTPSGGAMPGPRPARPATPNPPMPAGIPSKRIVTPSSPRDSTGTLPKAQRAVLTVLAQYGQRDKSQTALLAGYVNGTGGFNNALGALRSAGYIVGKGDLTITDAGLEALGEWEPLPTGPALVQHHSQRLSKASKEILGVLVDAYPEWLTKEQIAAATPSQYVPGTGGFNNGLGRLRSLELVVTQDGLNRAADVLVEGG